MWKVHGSRGNRRTSIGWRRQIRELARDQVDDCRQVIEGSEASCRGDGGVDLRVDHSAVPLKTITFDNGLEFSDHERISESLDVDLYFAHPYSSWERGANENTNGLIRQYFPKGMDLTKVTDKDIQFVMDRLNNRPRETLGWKTPNEVLWGRSVDLLAA